MRKIFFCVCLAACLGAFGAPTMGVDAGKYVIDVPAGETYTLTADDVTAIGTLPLVKAGEGTLKVDDVLKDYTGDIYVTNGFYQATTAGAVGTTNGVTHVLDGGTFNGTQEVPSSGSTSAAKATIDWARSGRHPRHVAALAARPRSPGRRASPAMPVWTTAMTGLTWPVTS